MSRFKIIVNPMADRGNAGKAIPEAETLFKNHGLDYSIVQTERPLHAIELAEQAVKEGFDVVVGMGGDGTLNEVLNGLAIAKKKGLGEAALGVLAVGRGNDFAFGAGAPIGLKNGCEALAAGHRHRIDIGEVWVDGESKSRFFGNGIGIGFDTVVGFEAAKMTHLHGFFCYVVAALKTLFLYYTPPMLEIRMDDEQLTQSSLMVSVMNGRRMGGGFMMAPESINNDGKLDLCIVGWARRLILLGLMLHFMRGTQAGKKQVRFHRSRKLEVTAIEGSLPCHADGETLCEAGKRLKVELHPGLLEVLTD